MIIDSQNSLNRMDEIVSPLKLIFVSVNLYATVAVSPNPGSPSMNNVTSANAIAEWRW